MRYLMNLVTFMFFLGITMSHSSFATEDEKPTSSSSTMNWLSYIASKIPKRVEISLEGKQCYYQAENLSRTSCPEEKITDVVPSRLKNENPRMVCVLNSIENCQSLSVVINALREVPNLRVLHVIGYFDKDTVPLLGALSTLEKLIFERETILFSSYVYTRLQTGGMTYARFAGLVNLQTLDMSKVSFIDKQASVFKIDSKGIPFKTLVSILGNMKGMQTLNLSDATLFPPASRNPGAGYMEWRKKEIEDCAKLLVQNFRGKKLLMVGNELDSTFIIAFRAQLESKDVQEFPAEIDFSRNNIPQSEIVSFQGMLTRKKASTKVKFDNNSEEESQVSEGKSVGYSRNELEQQILESILNSMIIND